MAGTLRPILPNAGKEYKARPLSIFAAGGVSIEPILKSQYQNGGQAVMVNVVQGSRKDAGNMGTWVTFANDCFTLEVPSFESPWFRNELDGRIDEVLRTATANIMFNRIAFPMRLSTNAKAFDAALDILVRAIGDFIGQNQYIGHNKQENARRELGGLEKIFIICETPAELAKMRALLAEKIKEIREMQEASQNGTVPPAAVYVSERDRAMGILASAMPTGAERAGGAVDSSGAALACMRAALEQVDLGARGGLATLGGRHRLRIPQPDAETEQYTAKQFQHKYVRRAFDGLGQNPGTKEDKNFLEYVQAYQTYQDQDNTVARAAKRRAADAARHSEHAKRPRVLEALDVEEEDLAPRAGSRRRSAVSGADEEALGSRREYDGAGGSSRPRGGAYAREREPFDDDVVEVGAEEAAAEEGARKRRREMEERHAREREAERRRVEEERRAEEERTAEEEQRKWDEAFCRDMDGYYNW
jgi:hypothetical protein